MMIRIGVESAKKFFDLIKSISAIVDYGTLRFGDECLTMRVADDARIVLIDLVLDKSMFSEYEVSGDGRIVTLSFQNLAKILKNIKKNDRLVLVFGDDDATLEVIGDVRKDFRINLLKEDYTFSEDLPVDFDISIGMSAESIRMAVDDCADFGDVVGVEIENGSLTFLSRDVGGGKEVRVRFDNVNIGVDSKAKASFDARTLERVLRAGAGLADNVLFELSSKARIARFRYALGGGRIDYYVASMLVVE